MARQIDLQDLYNRGALIVSLVNPGTTYQSSENGGDGIASLFDGDQSTSLRLTNTVAAPSGAPFEFVNLSFEIPIQAKRIKIRFGTSVTEDATLYINYGLSGIHSSQQSVAVTLEGDGSFETTDSFFNLTSFGEIFSIGLELGNSNSNLDHFINEIQLYIEEEMENKTFEFNDSVLSTKAWNSSRYDGKQLQASQVNLATRDDVGNNNRTPIVQKYTRNIYIGSRIIGMQAGNVEDGSLLNFDGFSYITVHEFITVNDDLTITKRSVRGDKPNTNFNNKKGFYKSWYQDFPLGSTCEIKVLDRKVEQSLKPSYIIYNNSGQLQKLLLVHQASVLEKGYTASYRPYTVWGQPDYDPGSDNFFYFASESVSIGDVNYKTGADFRIYNKTELINEFFTGSLTANEPPYYPGGSGAYEGGFDSGDPK